MYYLYVHIYKKKSVNGTQKIAIEDFLKELSKIKLISRKYTNSMLSPVTWKFKTFCVP